MTRSARRSTANYEIINNSVLCDAAFFHSPVCDLPVTFLTIASITIFVLLSVVRISNSSPQIFVKSPTPNYQLALEWEFSIDLGNMENYM